MKVEEIRIFWSQQHFFGWGITSRFEFFLVRVPKKSIPLSLFVQHRQDHNNW
ncbi:hypothetical protein JL09_g5957 [Pichia kudriavzevii]|uniref:Uncharacterized protein n=1 Tax=Pichia kudriavzevii TaxID=4909 RepID=A0A099NSB1_PICKU|nr:hypothetical protein JL09_g5957 [Pichia kudriavzevii]